MIKYTEMTPNNHCDLSGVTRHPNFAIRLRTTDENHRSTQMRMLLMSGEWSKVREVKFPLSGQSSRFLFFPIGDMISLVTSHD